MEVGFAFPWENTVKPGNKERFDKEQIGIKENFLWLICHLLHKDEELLALRNNIRATKKFLIAKFDCTTKMTSKMLYVALSLVVSD